MQYVLKMGFGKLADSYSGTTGSPNSGLGQDSRASPLGFMALSSLIINTYHCMGYGAKISSFYTFCLFNLSVVMYVDDTNLLHWPLSLGKEPAKLIEHIQWATMDYGRLTQASGGILKEKKCSHVFFGVQSGLQPFPDEITAGPPSTKTIHYGRGESLSGAYLYSPTQWAGSIH
jgi:hypothetical protein